MSGTLIKNLSPSVALYRDPVTGIAWVADGRAGGAHSCHPNISARGSLTGMHAKGWWGKDARTVKSHGFIYNVDELVTHDDLDRLAADFCECVGCLDRRTQQGFNVNRGRQACRLLVHAYKKGAVGESIEWSDVDLAANEAAAATGETLDAYEDDDQEEAAARRART